MTHLEIKLLLELAREYGVAKLKLQDLELEFHPPHTLPQVILDKELTPQTEEISDEDLLFYSVNGPAQATTR